MPSQIGVFVVAPPMLCWGFERVMEEAAAHVRVVGRAPHMAQAADDLQQVCADVVVLDFDEVLHAEALRAARLSRPVLLLAPQREQENLGQWTRAGAVAVLPKGSTADLLLFAIRSACAAARPASSGGAQESNARRAGCTDLGVDSLTLRERQLLFAVVSNSTTPGKVLAGKLCISEHTLRNHLTSVYGKLGVHGRLSLHEYALQRGIGEDPRFTQA